MIEVVGHGGAGDFFPGNSRRSVEKALELGVDRVEIDVQVAGDGTLILVHDDQVTLHGRKRSVRQLALSELQEGLDGLLTLDDVISLANGRAKLMVDLKYPGYEREVAAAITRAGIARGTIVSSTYAWSLMSVRNHAPEIAIGLSTGHISTVMRRNPLITATSAVVGFLSPGPFIAIAKAIGAEHLMLNYRICSPMFVRLADKAGLSVYPWTVNHPRVINKMIDAGVAGIISNRPDLVQDALTARER